MAESSSAGALFVMTSATYIRYSDTLKKTGKTQGPNHACSLPAKCHKALQATDGNEKITLTLITVISRVRLSPEGLAATDGVNT